MSEPTLDYLEKEQRIIQKLHDTNYALFDGDKDDAFDTLDSAFRAFPDYVNIVVQEQTMMPIWRARLEPEEFREHVTEIDRRRKNTHDVAIDSVNMMNRFSKALGLEPFAEVNTNDRHAVAEFVGQYVNQVYNHGIGGFDEAVKQAQRSGYARSRQDRLREIDAALDAQGISTEVTDDHDDYQP